MKINRIKICDFRNIENLDCRFDDVNIICGSNAQGKTNLLEALYLFTGARSFRGAKDGEMVAFGKKRAVLEVEFEGGGREQSARLTIEKKREASLNGIEKRSPAELGESIKAVVFSPAHLMMIKGAPEQRRRFADAALCQIKSGYQNVLKQYKNALRQRNAVLKDAAFSGCEELLEPFDEIFAKHGAVMIYQRQKYIEALLPFAKEIYHGISGGSEELELHLSCGFEAGGLSLEEIREKLFERLKENRREELAAAVTKTGPHRDDIDIMINGRFARLYGSQGQQRSAVLALKLAEASLLYEKTGIKPAAMLDDVVSELDDMRREYIINHLKDRQVFITCCDAESVLRLKKGKIIRMCAGKIDES